MVIVSTWEDRKPILITGSHRSGSTWLASMLALSKNSLMAHEPFNIQSWAYALDGLAKYWFTYAPALPQDAALEAYSNVIEQRTRKIFLKNQPQHWIPPLRHQRLIIKDPIAALSSDWIAKNFDLEVIVLVRHPAAFAASLKRLGWWHPLEHFLKQTTLMQTHLQPYRAEIASKPQDIVEQAAIIWKCLYSVLLTYLDSHPNWLVNKHEVLSSNPVAELRALYETLGLQWSATVEENVVRYTRCGNSVDAPKGTVHHLRRDSVANIARWKETLTAEEIARVYEITRPIYSSYYQDEDWGDFAQPSMIARDATQQP
jgi:Sulfotransferase family